VFVAFTLAAFAVRSMRTPTAVGKCAWRLTLTGYVAACLAVAAEYGSQWGSWPGT
jgi:hypothetical protein